MKDWRHKYQVLLITLISFWVLIFPTYCLFYSLDGVDAFRSPHWENPVQEDLLIDLQKKDRIRMEFLRHYFPPGK